MEKTKPDISLIFPVYRDEHTVRRVTEKAIAVLSEVGGSFEIIIVDDASPDRSGAVAEELSRERAMVRVFHHSKNLGYGAAVKTGLSHAQYEWICQTDGDDEYDVYDIHKLLRLRDFYDLIITFRYVKVYSGTRQFISWVYNVVLRMLFRTPYRDISSGLRMMRKALLDELVLESDSSFIGAEIAIKTMLKGYRVGEVGIQTFPRQFGAGASTSVPNIIATIREMLRTYRTIFSTSYDLPFNRRRGR